jgi:hypothetical protein
MSSPSKYSLPPICPWRGLRRFQNSQGIIVSPLSRVGTKEIPKNIVYSEERRGFIFYILENRGLTYLSSTEE